jgi:hypothetical protein
MLFPVSRILIGPTADILVGVDDEDGELTTLDQVAGIQSYGSGSMLIVRKFVGTGAIISYDLLRRSKMLDVYPGAVVGLWVVRDDVSSGITGSNPDYFPDIPEAAQKRVNYRFLGPALRIAVGSRKVRFGCSGRAIFNLSRMSLIFNAGLSILPSRGKEVGR